MGDSRGNRVQYVLEESLNAPECFKVASIQMLLKLEEHVEIAELRELFLTSLCDRSCPCWDFRWGILIDQISQDKITTGNVIRS